jgi:hypothetical protein
MDLKKRYSFDRLRLGVGEISGRVNQMSISKESGKSGSILVKGRNFL